jgi:hypothetical protein
MTNISQSPKRTLLQAIKSTNSMWHQVLKASSSAERGDDRVRERIIFSVGAVPKSTYFVFFCWLVVQFAHLEKYDFVNGKDYPIYYGK